MKILKQITIVFLLCWLGEVISALLPFAFPGSIVAMLLLLGCLSTSLLRIEDISGFAGFLLANMAFFFIPAGVSILDSFGAIQNDLLPILAVIVLSTLITAAVTCGSILLITKLREAGVGAMNELLNGPFFFTGLCLIVYLLACRLQRITRKTWLNPLLVSILILIGILLVLRIPYAHFKEGSSVIAMMLTPATCVLAIPMYNQRKILKQNLTAILIGTFLGALSSILSVTLLCRIFGLNELITRSLLPKSVTTPIAVSVCEVSGGLPAITVAAVILTGILGSIVIPLLFTKLKIKNSVALGITLGTASHAMGTSKAIEIGEQEGGLSGLAIGITGIFTVILSLLL